MAYNSNSKSSHSNSSHSSETIQIYMYHVEGTIDIRARQNLSKYLMVEEEVV
jgi:hypothetical protein